MGGFLLSLPLSSAVRSVRRLVTEAFESILSVVPPLAFSLVNTDSSIPLTVQKILEYNINNIKSVDKSVLTIRLKPLCPRSDPFIFQGILFFTINYKEIQVVSYPHEV